MLPVLLLLVFGMVTLGQLLHARTVLLMAASQGARRGAVVYGTPGVPPEEAEAQVQQAALSLVDALLTGQSRAAEVAAGPEDVTVTVRLRLRPPVPWIVAADPDGQVTLSQRATYRIERQ